MTMKQIVRRLRLSSWLNTVRRSRVIDVLSRAVQDFTRDDGTIYAAAVTYYVLLSLFPFLIFLVTVFGLIIRDEGVQERVIQQIIEQFPAGVNLDEQVRSVVESVAETDKSLLGLTAILGAAWTASGVVGALRRALNSAFDVPAARSFITGRARDVMSVLAVIVLLLLSTILTAILSIARVHTRAFFSSGLTTFGWELIVFVLPTMISFVFFLLVYRWIPNHTLGWRDLWTGSLIAAVGFELAKVGFSFYLSNFDRYGEVYGALGGVVAFLFFVFLIANLTIFAAEIDSELAKDREAGTSSESRVPSSE